MNRTLKITLITLLSFFILWITVSYFAARYLIRPNKIVIKNTEEINGIKPESITLKTIDEIEVSAWYLDNNSDKAIILLSGIRGNRLNQISRAEFYLKQGFSVFLPDLRGTGKSSGDYVSFGWHERNDFIACYNFLKAK